MWNVTNRHSIFRPGSGKAFRRAGLPRRTGNHHARRSQPEELDQHRSANPYKNASDKAFVKHKLREQLRGYVAVTDSPPIQFVQELMEIYPHAKVICTVRDPDDWWRSMEPVIRNAKMPFLRFVFYRLPTLRYFVTCYKAMENGRYRELYIQDGNNTFVRETYDYHMRYLKRVVPEEKLHFFSVEDRWEPLCKLLDKPVPDEPSPRVNDAATVESFFKSMVLKGLLRWA